MKTILVIILIFFSFDTYAELGLACGSLMNEEDDQHVYRGNEYPTHAYADPYNPLDEKHTLRDLIYEGEIFTEYYHSERGFESYLKILRREQCEDTALPCRLRIGLDIDANGKFEAVFSVTHDEELSDEVFGVYYKGTVTYYSNDPQNPARQRAVCVFSYF